MEEQTAPTIDQIVWMCDGAYTACEVRRMEMLVLKTFNWGCCVATALQFAELLSAHLNLPAECMALTKVPNITHTDTTALR